MLGTAGPPRGQQSGNHAPGIGRRHDGRLADEDRQIGARPGRHAQPRSLRITSTVADQESWTDLAFPQSGTYVFPRRPGNRPHALQETARFDPAKAVQIPVMQARRGPI